MTKEKLYLIYDLILKEEKITTEKLYSRGISKPDLEEMIQENKLDKTSKGEYTISSNDSLYHLGVSLTNNREYDRGMKYLEKYYELNPLNKEVKLVLISIYISKKQYQKVFPILDELLKTNNKKEQKDYLLILYLLSIICPYPEKYTDTILNMKYDDFLYTDTENKNYDITKHNQMRIRIFQNKFNQAEETFNRELINTYSSKTEKDIIRKLLSEVKRLDNRRNEALEQYAKEKQYQSIISLIEKKKSRMRLSLGDEMTYKITKDIIRIKETNKIPRPQTNEAETVKAAIDGKNYYLALQLNNTNKKGMSDSNIRRTVSILLIDINKLISAVLKEYKERIAKEKNISETKNNNPLTKKRIKE